MLSSDFVIEYARRALIYAEHDLVQILRDSCCMLLNTIRLTLFSIQLLIATCIHTTPTACMLSSGSNLT
jgi:hypothetical protein